MHLVPRDPEDLNEERLDQAVALARRDDRCLAVLFIDLDRFKAINDSLGHPMGDRLLIEVGQRLRASVRDSDVVARFGGTVFGFWASILIAALVVAVDKALAQAGKAHAGKLVSALAAMSASPAAPKSAA